MNRGEGSAAGQGKAVNIVYMDNVEKSYMDRLAFAMLGSPVFGMV